MRTLIGFAAIAIAAMFSSAAPAAAKWTCEGPAYVCGDAPSSASPSSKSSYKKSKKSYDEASYDKPAKKKKYYDNDSGGGSTFSGKAS